jgi:hypothetical protein
MYKDYHSAQGQAIETIPGFRAIGSFSDGGVIYGIHAFGKKILVHSGHNLWLWRSYPAPVGVGDDHVITLPDEYTEEESLYVYSISHPVSFEIDSVEVKHPNGTSTGVPNGAMSVELRRKEIIIKTTFKPGQKLIATYYAQDVSGLDKLYSNMNDERSSSFIINNRMYIIDGKNYLVFDGEEVIPVEGYIPTTYINIMPNKKSGERYEFQNVLSNKFINTFVGDGESKEYYLLDTFSDIESVTVYGEEYPYYADADEGEPSFTYDSASGKVIFSEAPSKPEDAEYAEGEAGIVITAIKKDDISDVIKKNRIVTIYDDHVFLSGNPDYPNNIYYCHRNNGYTDPTYFPLQYYAPAGVGLAPITGMLVIADTLMVLKSDSQQDGSVYYFTPELVDDDLYPTVYVGSRGLAGTGCLGACVNFLDDPVFVSKGGLEAMGQLSTRLERAIEHRSSLVDAKLTNLDLSKATLHEWDGYLILHVEDKLFLADSRQRYSDDLGNVQYEWYYIEGVGEYVGQFTEFKYMSVLPEYLEDTYILHENEYIPISVAPEYMVNTVANLEDGKALEPQTAYRKNKDGIYEAVDLVYVKVVDGKAYLCTTKGAKTGGKFHPALTLAVVDNNIFFGTDTGHLFCFNFDKRKADGTIDPQYYTFNGRAIFSGCATKMDNCDVPHLTKSTVKKSTVIKTKSMISAAAKIKVRTNNDPYKQIARISTHSFSFEDLDFSDFSFLTLDNGLYAVKEKEKHWVEKQYFIYSDEFMKPFSCLSIAWRYMIAGRFKQR